MDTQNLQDMLSTMSFVDKRTRLDALRAELETIRSEEIPDIDRMLKVTEEVHLVQQSMVEDLGRIESLIQAQQGASAQG